MSTLLSQLPTSADDTPDFSSPLPAPADPCDLYAWACYYRSRGLVVVPLNAERTPIDRWVHYRTGEGVSVPYDATLYERDWIRWRRQWTWQRTAKGVGVLIEFSFVVCVDLDVPIETVGAHLQGVIGTPLDAPARDAAWVRTRSGRCHLWYAWPHVDPPPNLTVERAAQLGCANVEIKGASQCVPLPPTVSGDVGYTWESGGIENLALPPAWVYTPLDVDPTSPISSVFVDDGRRTWDSRVAAWRRKPDVAAWLANLPESNTTND